jgi:diadenosine tetraphosphate (Ap4A) HIT family hydrolase
LGKKCASLHLANQIFFSADEKAEIFRVLDIVEKLMLSYFNADKINIASFGNLLPQVHWHR